MNVYKNKSSLKVKYGKFNESFLREMTQSQSFLDSDDDDLCLSLLEQYDSQQEIKQFQNDSQSEEFQCAQVIQYTQTQAPTRELIRTQNLNQNQIQSQSKSVTPTHKKKQMIRADMLDPNFVYFTHTSETEPIYRNNSGQQVFIKSRPFWKIPFQNYRRVVSSLKNPSAPIIATVDQPPDSIFTSMFSFHPMKVSTSILDNLPKRLQSALYPHQRESVLFAASRNFRVFIADDMGLGKTIEAISIACAANFPKKIRVIVLAPNHLVSTWVDSFLKWTDICQSKINVLTRSEKISSTPLVIASYNAAVRKSDELQSHQFDLVIADESHELKNTKTQLYQKVSPILRQSKYLILLSGTPMTKPSELYPQINLLLPKAFSSFKDFGTRYCHGELNSFGHFEANGCTHSEELRTVLEHLIMLRREKDEVLTDLPIKKRFHVMLDYIPSPEMKEQVEQMRIHRIALATGMETMKTEQNTIMTTAFSITALDKLPAVLSWFCGSEFRRSFFIEQRKCIVFAFHRNVIDGVTEWMQNQGVKCISVSGSTPKEKRDSLFREFKINPECKVAVLRIEIAATGITLTEASLVVFAELKWTPSDHQQAEDRAHRIGQSRDVEIYYLHASGSLDDRIWEILERKLVVISSVITSKTKTFETDTNAK